MKTFKTKLLTIAVLLCSISASAYDFEVDGIYYNITSNKDLTVEVTYGLGGCFSAQYHGSVKIPNTVEYNGNTYSVTSIGTYAFYDCTDLTDITIPNSVTSIGGYAFSGAPWYEQQPDGIIYVNNVLYKYKGEMPANTSIEIKESTISISCSAFSDCTGLTNITIPNSVTSIGDYAFRECTSLTSITIPNSVTSIGEWAFYYCTSLTNVTISEFVTSIGEGAFLGCDNLTSIIIPNLVTSIGENAFEGCDNLAFIVIPNSLTEIGEYAFLNCYNLKTIINYSKLSITKGSFSYGYIGRHADKIINFSDLEYEQYGDFIFRNEENFKFYLSAYTGSESCPSLPENFYGKTYEIDEYAFFCNRNITDITIPEFVTSIGNYAFDECENLKTITIATATPPKVGKRNFSTMSFRTVVVKVPQGSLAAYQAADFWQSFWNIEEFGSNSIEEVEINVNSVTAPIYNLQGVQMKESKEHLPAGIYIQGGKKMIIR